MTSNPFNQNKPTPATQQNDEPPETEPLPPQVTKQFINRVLIASAMFLVLVFSVLREIQHNRDLYRMSQLVNASDTRAREWQDRCRLEEAREASLEAELQSQPLLTGSPRVMKADYMLPN